jgi:hypothetical protein
MADGNIADKLVNRFSSYPTKLELHQEGRSERGEKNVERKCVPIAALVIQGAATYEIDGGQQLVEG